MAENYTKKQHYIPQFLLKNFIYCKGRIWVFDKQKKNLSFKQSAKGVAYKDDLYSIDYGTHKDDALEKQFSEQERIVAPILKSVLETKTFPTDNGEKEKLFSFLWSLFLRAPHMVEAVNDPALVMKALERRNPDMTERERAYHSETVNIKGLGQSITFDPTSKDMSSRIQANFYSCLITSDSKSFILNDKYGAYTHSLSEEERKRIQSKIQEGGNNSIFYDICDYIFCPIASNACILFINKRKKGIFAKSCPLQELGGIEYVNMGIASNAKQYLFGSDKESLEKAVQQAQAHEWGARRSFRNLLDRLQSSAVHFNRF